MSYTVHLYIIYNIYLVILYRKGKHQLVNYFVGEAMMQSRFRVDQDILEKVMILLVHTILLLVIVTCA
jgi:hypothetical protein